MATRKYPKTGSPASAGRRHGQASPERVPTQSAAWTTPAGGVPRAPGALPLVGHAWALARRPLDFLASLAALDDVVEIRIGRTPAYVVSDPELTRVLTDGDAFTQGVFADLLKPVSGTSLETTSGDEHRWYRRRAQPAFGRAMHAMWTRVMWQEAAATAETWQPGQVIDVCHTADDLAAKIIARCMFSATTAEALAATINKTLPIIAEAISLRNPRPAWWWGRVPLPGDHAVNKAGQELRDAVQAAIRVHRSAGSEGEGMLSAVLAASQAHGDALSDLQLLDMMGNLIGAGANNSGKTISWSLYELDANPAIAQQVYTEIDEFLAQGAPDEQTVPDLPYLGAVVTETLRKYGNLAITRRTAHPVKLGRFDLPAGAHIIVSPHTMGRDPRFFPDPDLFDPSRWLPGGSASGTRHAYIPFGIGTYRCIGDRFALNEITIALVTICARWRLRLVPGHQVRRRAVVSVLPSSLHMTAEPRHHPTGAVEK